MSRNPRSAIRETRRGTILIVTMLVIFTLAGMVLVFCSGMRVEAISAANRAAEIQAAAVERGAEQYLLAMLSQEGSAILTMPEEYFAAIPVGEGYFWLLRPNWNDDTLPVFGVVDEAAKLNINTASYDMLMALPNMTDDVAAAIIDWRDADDTVYAGGAESDYYLSLPEPYHCKNAPFETVEELLLVRNVTRRLLYGDETANAGDPWTRLGLHELLTVYSREPASGGSGGGNQPSRGRINLLTAPREVLACLPGLDSTDVDRLLQLRNGADSSSMAWVAEAIGGRKYAALASRITAQSYQYTADILAVSGNGRAFKRCRVVVDTMSSPPRIVYRRDLSAHGWPMDPEILTGLRSGQGPGAWASLVTVAGGGGVK